jgi:KDO2-lipid IV(A) lauroyltransferase
VILVATHLDNVDLAGCSISVRGRPITVPAKNVGWKPAAKFIIVVRERTGIELIPTKQSMDLIRKRLAENKIVGLVIDQHLRPRHAIVCKFFDQLTATTHAPARLAVETGATILIGLVYRKGMSRYHVVRPDEFTLELPYDDDAANVRHNTERLNRVVEDWIRKYPEQWLWPHVRWKVHDSPEGWEIPDDLRPLLDSDTAGKDRDAD